MIKKSRTASYKGSPNMRRFKESYEKWNRNKYGLIFLKKAK